LLPAEDSEPVELKLDQKLPGWASFPPHQTPGQLSLVTDAGKFAVYGIQSQSAGQQRLFLKLEDQLRPQEGHDVRGPAEGGYAGQDFYWVLAHGRLHKLQPGFFRATGPKLLPPWLEPVPLGSPVQPAQVRPAPDGGKLLYLATRPAGARTCLVSALRSNYG